MKKKTYRIVVIESDGQATGESQIDQIEVTDEQVRVVICAVGGLDLHDDEKEVVRPLIVGLMRHWKPVTT